MLIICNRVLSTELVNPVEVRWELMHELISLCCLKLCQAVLKIVDMANPICYCEKSKQLKCLPFYEYIPVIYILL